MHFFIRLLLAFRVIVNRINVLFVITIVVFLSPKFVQTIKCANFMLEFTFYLISKAFIYLSMDVRFCVLELRGCPKCSRANFSYRSTNINVAVTVQFFFLLFSDVWTWAALNFICILVSEEPSEMHRLYPIRVLKASRYCLPSSRNWSTISFAYTANKAHSTLMTRGKMHTFLEFTCSPGKRKKKKHRENEQKKMNTKRDRRRQTKHCYGFWLKWRKIKIK